MLSPYPVNINDGPDSALDDLKELPEAVRGKLLAVIRDELPQTPRSDSDIEGRILPVPGSHEWLWRRGISIADLTAWRSGALPDPDTATAAEFVIVYAFFTRAEARVFRYHIGADYPGFYVWRILRNAAIAGQAVRAVLHRPPGMVAGPGSTW
ncbi:hypothetical protein [Actinoplanes sp. N902-109]|uniref:hypothetical protein n=1 Tax=Actinoplanes sp. (strain N902-109) TaxID=649831 RepID=UPI00032957E6|nr:hypothetical protein [Actinoplanes sp. N902-109]AGL15673.1 hypothetical protein L083_2163 [Actinoplanes sp. N902-109]